LFPAGGSYRRLHGWAACAALVHFLGAIGAGGASGESWDDLKGEWAKQGITPSLQYQGDGAANAVGGARRGATYLGNLHLQLTLDGDTLIGAPGLTAFVDSVDIHGGQASRFVGDAQGVSNIAGPPGFTVYEAWLQYNFLDNRLSVLAGRYDLNTEFYRLQSASLFLNSSFGIGPEFAFSGFNGPSIFPDTSVGSRLAYKPTPNTVIRVAILDGSPVRRAGGNTGLFESGDGVLLVSELAYLDRPVLDTTPHAPAFRIGRNPDDTSHDGKIALGGWYYSARFDDLSAVDASGQAISRRGSGGAYVVAERTLLKSTGDHDKSIVGFVQAGIGDKRVDRFGSYVGAGLAATGYVPGRPDDQLGIAVAVARNGSHYMRAQSAEAIATDRAETALELTYQAMITDWLTVQPDAQYVVHPNTDPSRRNALVFQLQFQLSF
jgi:porin